MIQSRHCQIAALQLIFVALGSVPLLGKANNISPFKQNLTKFELNSSQQAKKPLKNFCFALIVTNFESCGPKRKMIFKFGPQAKSLATD